MRPRADNGNLLTLHYSIGAAEDEPLVSTFGASPATLALGAGELAPGLERCLEDLEPGARRVFVLEPQDAFGARRDELLRSVPRASFPRDTVIEEGAVVEFQAPDGEARAGVVRGESGTGVSVDFNHPLAGRRVRFEVELIARTEFDESKISSS